MDTPSPPKHSRNKLLHWLLAVIVFLCGISITWVYWQEAQKQEQATLNVLFTSQADSFANRLSQRFRLYEVVMRGLQGFFQGSEEISYEEFVRYTTALNATADLRGVQAIAYVADLSREQLAHHLEKIRSDLPVAFHIHPTTDRPKVAPIIFIDPLNQDNLRALGFDILTNPVAREAVEKSRATGDMVITAPLTLIQDATDQKATSFVMYLPVYHNDRQATGTSAPTLRGWIDVPFRLSDLVDDLADPIDTHIDIKIYDQDTAGGLSLLYGPGSNAGTEPNAASEMQVTRQLDVGTRRWSLLFSPTPAFFENATLSRRSPLLPITGGAISFALALLVFNIARSRDQSERRAARLSHLYHALSEVNQAIVRMDTEAELLPLVCQMTVDYGGMAMAWVGCPDERGNKIVPVASYGEGTRHLPQISDATRNDSPDDPDPCWTALLEEQPAIFNNYSSLPETASWHRAARRYGWKASAAFPIRRNGKSFAVLFVYHHHANAFEDDVVRLILEMTSDIGFALDNFDRERQRLAYEQALKDSETKLSTILDSVGACIYLKDTDGRYLFANQRTLELWNARREDVLGYSDEKFFDAQTVARIQSNDRRVFEQGEMLESEEVDTVKSTGITRIYWSIKLPLRDSDGKIYALCGISTDITDHRAREEQIQFLSHYDSLTALPNRHLLQEKIRKAVTSATVNRDEMSLVWINLDRFKIINESLGHALGDQLLSQVAERLQTHQDQGSTLGRLDSDNFLLLLEKTGPEQAITRAKQLQAAIQAPLSVNSHKLVLTACIGIASFPSHGRSTEQLFQSADLALVHAKKKGPGTLQVFTELLQDQADEFLQLEHELRDAISGDQLILHYQPQVDIDTGRITGMEALVRWEHPKLGRIAPDRFIPIAEESGLILDVGLWVMNTAASQIIQWRREGLDPPSVAVNISSIELYRESFYQSVVSVIDRHNLPKRALELELTERIAMEHSRQTIATLTQLRDAGVSLAIDDFGTGYSSLSYLKRYPIEKLKIDKSFIDGLSSDSEDQAIVAAIIGIARGLGYRTVAEGVETPEQLRFLKAQGCNEYQGYYFSKPVSANELTVLLEKQKRPLD